jgi:hypothetical protein
MNGKSGYTGSGGATLFVLKSDNRPIEMDVSGIVTQVEVADINADGSPELYVHGFDGKSQTLLA